MTPRHLETCGPRFGTDTKGHWFPTCGRREEQTRGRITLNTGGKEENSLGEMKENS